MPTMTLDEVADMEMDALKKKEKATKKAAEE